MKRIKNLWLRIPRSVRLGLNLLLILGILYTAWAMEDFHAPTANGAYRQALRKALLPDDSRIELQVDIDHGYLYAVGADDRAAYGVKLRREDLMLWESSVCCAVPLTDGVAVMQLPGRQSEALRPKQEDLNGDHIIEYVIKEAALEPSLAVKLNGAASVQISLELDDFEHGSYRGETDLHWSGGTYPMLTKPAENCWFLASFDVKCMGQLLYKTEEEANQYHLNCYYLWIEAFEQTSFQKLLNGEGQIHGRYRITALDESGEVIKTLIWEP